MLMVPHSCLRADGQARLYVFKGSHFWEVAADGNVSAPHLLQERWAGLPSNIEAAAVSLDDGDFYFFKGNIRRQRDAEDRTLLYPCKANALPLCYPSNPN